MEVYRGFDIVSLDTDDEHGNFWTVCKDGKEVHRDKTIDDCFDWIDKQRHDSIRSARTSYGGY